MVSVKTCTKCKETKTTKSYSKGSGRNGLRSICKSCSAKITKAWRKKNVTKVRKQKLKWQKENGWYSRENWAKRKASKLQATPKWGQEKLVVSPYKLAVFLNKMTNSKYEVDHIVPLQSDIVCGLHVNDNLQVLDQKTNRLKSNKWETKVC